MCIKRGGQIERFDILDNKEIMNQPTKNVRQEKKNARQKTLRIIVKST